MAICPHCHRSTVTRKKAVRKKAARKKKPPIQDVDRSTEVDAFRQLADRLQDVYQTADARAGEIRDQIQMGLQKLESELNTAVDKFTDEMCDGVEVLLVEVEERRDELEDQDLRGDNNL